MGVQVFFVISGFLYGNKDIYDPLDFLVKRFKKLLIPYWLFLLIAIVLYAAFSRENLHASEVLKSIVCADTIKGLGHLWFVGYILFCYILTPYLQRIRIRLEKLTFWKAFIIIALLLLMVQILGIAFESYFQPDRVSCYIIGYYMPILIRKANKSIKAALLGMLVLVAIVMNTARIYLKYYAIGVVPEVLVNGLVRYAHLALGVALFAILFRALRNVKYNVFLKWSDAYSYPIYLVHQFFIISPFTLMAVTQIKSLNWAIVLVATIVLAIMIDLMAKHLITRRI